MGQLVLLMLSFVVGFQIGRCSRPSTTPTTFEVKAEELTVESLRARLKDLGISSTGLKAELVERFEKATAGTKLRLTRAAAASRPRAGVQME